MSNASAALKLYDRGICVVAAPVAEKAPTSSWKAAQSKRPTRAATEKAFSSPHNLFVICGSISRLVVLDCDDKKAVEYWRDWLGPVLDETTCVITGKGKHYWFSLPEGEVRKGSKSVGGPTGTWDLQAEGKGVIAPPSVHASGKVYRWAAGHDLDTLKPAPAKMWSGGEKPSNVVDIGARRRATQETGAPLVDGARNDDLTSLAGTMRRRGMTEGEIFVALSEVNRSRCEPPLNEADVKTIAKSIGLYLPASKQTPLTDVGNGERFAAEQAESFRYVHGPDRWHNWNDVIWLPDAAREAEQAAKQIARNIARSAADIEDDTKRKAAFSWAIKSEASRSITATLLMARTEPPLSLTPDCLDTDPWLLACADGTIDLRTGDLRKSQPGDLITMQTSIGWAPDAKCPRWEQFLEEVFEGDAELILFIQRFIGYCLTGVTRERLLTVFHGEGWNGKSTILRVMQQLLGDHATTAAIETFLRSRDSRGTRNDLARLYRARLVTAAESAEGRKLDEASVKELTGRDRITARFLYEENFEFTPMFKLLFVTNHPPRVNATDEAIWDRLRLVPFMVDFRGCEDETLDELLTAELPAILPWAVQGCLDWQRDGLGQAKAIEQATTAYREEEDILARFLKERGTLDAGLEVTSKHFRQLYRGYCDELEEPPLGDRELGKQLTKHGVKHFRQSGGKREYVYGGVSVK
jgi:putative DNA primase/helicase